MATARKKIALLIFMGGLSSDCSENKAEKQQNKATVVNCSFTIANE
jgi:hypothetical protein